MHSKYRTVHLKEVEQQISSNKKDFIYQPLQLDIVTGIINITNRNQDNQEIEEQKEVLNGVNGLKPVLGDMELKNSFLRNMSQNDNNCDFLICVAMYNEGYEHLKNTLTGIIDNLKTFQSNNVDAKRIACVIIVDGMKAFLETYKRQSAFSYFFDEECIKKKFKVNDPIDCKLNNQGDFDEFAHCFIRKNNKILIGNSGQELNLIFCVKQANKRKLNTHLWFFGGFCKMIKPKFVMLLDIGTKPLPNSLYYLYDAMEKNDQVAGCCGEIRPMNYDLWKIALPAQLVEYKFAHMLDKALESVIGYITVLPGAFSAYRWKALDGDTLWKDYFKPIFFPQEMNAYYSNIYLAEDRVLCFSLVAQKNKSNLLRYVRRSKALTDIPETLSDLMAQRRRWTNGSWFGLIDTIKNCGENCKKIHNTSHSCTRKLCLYFQMIYFIATIAYTWFIVGLFCLAYSITIFKNFNNQENEDMGTLLIAMYIGLLLVIFITSLSVSPGRVKDFFKGIAVIMGMYQFYVMYLILKFMAQTDYSRYSSNVVLSVGVVAGLFLFIVLVNNAILVLIMGVIHYIFLIPTYVNIFSIYSICNLHDCSWGNRPDQMTKEELNRADEFQLFRTKWVIIWVICNAASSYVAYWVYKYDNIVSFWVIASVTIVGISIIVLRGIFGFIFILSECYKDRKSKINPINNCDENKVIEKKAYLKFKDERSPENITIGERP